MKWLTRSEVPLIIPKIKVTLSSIYEKVNNVSVLDQATWITFENKTFPMLLWAHSTYEVSFDLRPMEELAKPASILR